MVTIEYVTLVSAIDFEPAGVARDSVVETYRYDPLDVGTVLRKLRSVRDDEILLVERFLTRRQLRQRLGSSVF